MTSEPDPARPPATALVHDPLWPRTGSWPAPGAGDSARDSDLTLVGVGTHRTSLSPSRADTTPAAIRAALRRYSAFANVPGRGAVDLERELRFADAGDLLDPDHGADPDADGVDGEQRAIAALSALARRTRLLLALGGDNAATVPVALGAWGDRIAEAGLITFDAHHDLREGISNGSPVRRLIEAGLDPRRIVQIGIADFANSLEYSRRARCLGITVITRDELFDRPIADAVAEALEIAGGAGPTARIHVDVDVDVCDRSVAPGCPASVPGGLSAAELRRAVRTITADARVASLDLTEIDAAADAPDGRTVRLAAQLVLESAAGLAARP
ncbi:arginase family protein [Schumannella soli]|uniref:Formimidoylglutamase n=1 Tax=Schumannella soli TaxID=2590779 RepID=A0A506Y336_9MICO|nr:arginase family protein [Schumannella soli]TPW76445.1 formimidoylglutamase [Schumannella soli]